MEQRKGESGIEFMRRLKRQKQELLYWVNKMPSAQSYEMRRQLNQIISQISIMHVLGIRENDEKEC